ncbi:MAG: C45 family autoproteolytic acyltransferase/hydrolase [Bacillota bacterium]
MEKSMKEAVYRHIVVEGASYEIGKELGEYIKQYHPELIDLFIKGNEYIKPASEMQVEKTIKLFEKYCPNINKEVNGFADSIGVNHKSIIYYSFSNVCSSNCGHFAVLPSKTTDRHLYVGRNYEWNTNDELSLITTRAKGLNAHLGFSLLLFGRYEGINEYGLCITMSNGAPMINSEEEGLRFWAVIRILLDICKTVDEAVELINELPISSHCNLIIADRNNNAVLAEISNSTKAYKRISPDTRDSYVCSTNHYTLDELQNHVRNRMRQSIDRYNAIKECIDKKEAVSKEDLRTILSAHMPDGLTCHYYEYGLGTLWSILFDVTKVQADVCFGSPVCNKWYTFDLMKKPGITEYIAELPFETADPEIWKHI